MMKIPGDPNGPICPSIKKILATTDKPFHWPKMAGIGTSVCQTH